MVSSFTQSSKTLFLIICCVMASVLPQGFATVVYDAKGNELTKLVAANSNRSYEKMDRIPKHLADAFVAVEDERFYDHNGIDIREYPGQASCRCSDRR
mgnify:CR=1 FL=1